MGQMNQVIPRCLGCLGIGPGQKHPVPGDLRPAGPDLLAVDHPLVPIPFGAGLQRCQVGTRVGLREQLAPLLLAGEDRPQVSLLLSGVAEGEQGRRRPTHGDGVVGATHARRGQLLVDDQFLEDIGALPVRLRETGLNVTGPRQLLRAGIGMVGKPVTDPEAPGIIGREPERSPPLNLLPTSVITVPTVARPVRPAESLGDCRDDEPEE